MTGVKKAGLILVYAVFLLVVGCAGHKEVTHSTDDRGYPVTTETTSSFWKSENLQAHYDYKTISRVEHSKGVAAQADALAKVFSETKVAHQETQGVLAALYGVLIAQLGNYQEPTDRAPATAAEALRDVPQWILAATALWNTVDSNRGSRSYSNEGPTIKGDGNIYIARSNLGSGENSQAQFYFKDYSYLFADASGGMTGGSIRADRPISNTTDNSYTRGDSKSDSSLF